jgi:hypothetical protein
MPSDAPNSNASLANQAAFIAGDVHTGGGDFVGRDKITINNYLTIGLARLAAVRSEEMQAAGSSALTM